MKKLLAVLATFLIFLSVSAAQSDTLKIAAEIIQEPSNAQNAVSNSASGKNSVKLSLNLAAIDVKKISFAMLEVTGKSGEGNCNASISLYHKSKIVAAKTFKEGVFTAGFIVTNLINEALKQNKTSVDITLAQDGIVGQQKDFFFQKATLIIAPKSYYDRAEYMRAIWKAGKITDESVFFIDEENGNPPSANLLFKPTKIIRAHTILGDKTFTQGKDFIVEGNKIILTPNSAIYARPISQTYPATKENADKWKCKFKFAPINKYGLYNEGYWFHERMVYFTYEHQNNQWACEKFGESFNPTLLPNTIKKLKSGKSVKITLFGDSISNGSNASGFAPRKPFMPSWGDLVADTLRVYYKKADITYLNRAMGGTNCKWGVKNIDSLVAAEKPDLIIIAFGMNDGIDASKRTQELNKMMEIVKAKNPNAEFIIVTGMQPNSMWRNLNPHASYPESDKKMQTTHVAVADIWDIHAYMISRKKFIDMTGNNVNHPNDFLIRLYAQVVASKLMEIK